MRNGSPDRSNALTRATAAIVVAMLLMLICTAPASADDAAKELIERANKLMRQREFDAAKPLLADAVKKLQAAILAEPQDAELHFDLSRAYWAQGKKGQSIASLSQAVLLAPDNRAYRLERFRRLRSTGRIGETIKDIKAALKETPDDADLLIELAKARTSLGQYEEAQEALSKAGEIDPNNDELHHTRGMLLARQRQLDAAVKAFEQHVSLHPDHFAAHYNLAQIYQLQGNNEKALKHFLKADEIAPNDAGALAKLIQCFQATGDIKNRNRYHDRYVRLYRDGRILNGRFCRDQFIHANHRVIVIEHLDVNDKQVLKYVFFAYDKAGTALLQKITLGLSPLYAKVQIAQGKLRPGQRLYHLEWRRQREYRSYAMYYGEPAYDKIRQKVMEVLDGRAKPETSLGVDR